MGFDYNQFTKAELVEFLNKHEDDFRYITKPYLIILEEKMDKVMKQIDKSINEGKILIERLENEPENISKIHLDIWENNKKWNRLSKKYDELSKLAYGR